MHQIGPELGEHRGEQTCWVLLEVPPAREELVAGAVPLRQRLPLVGEAELEVGPRPLEAGGDLQRSHARLLLQEEDSHLAPSQ